MPARKTVKKAAKKTTATKRKTTKRATSTKRTIAKKTTKAVKKTAKRTTAKKTTKRAATIKEPMTKSQLLNSIAEDTEMNRKEVAAVLESLSDHIERSIKKNAAGMFTIPGLAKVVVVRKPATKRRKGINPFTGEEIMIKAKPARNVVKVRPLKKLKEMAV